MNETLVTPKVLSQPELSLMEERPEPCALVILGGMGDLAHRKLYPTLAYLHQQNLLPSSYAVVVVARREMDDEALRKKVGESIIKAGAKEIPAGFLERLFFVNGDLGDAGFYARLKTRLDELSKDMQLIGHMFYFATSPALYSSILKKMAEAGLNKQEGLSTWPRVIIEKPFGTDLESAISLNKEIHSILPENQVYRIDHYLGKETVQNILILRFANTFFEPAWNRDHVDHVQITVAESIGIEGRGTYYDQAGVLRDMFQNHLLQLLSLVAMEPPARFQADPISDAKINILRAIPDMSAQNLVLGQYASSQADGKHLPGYREEAGISSDSRTPTFAAARLEVDNWRWHGVPFYLRSGKRLPKRMTEIAVHFKHVPVSIFKPLLAEELAANTLKLRLQPDEGVSVSFETKHPGSKISLSTVTMNFDYYKAFGISQPEAYARLILDAFIGDRTLFTRSDFVEEAWRILAPVLEVGNKSKVIPVRPYGSTAGDWGPHGVGELLVRDGRTWDHF